MNDSTMNILNTNINYKNFTFHFDLNILGLVIIIVIMFGVYLLINYIVRFINKKSDSFVSFETIKFDKGISGEFKIYRNYKNIEIAHKIYIELITRKAAIPIDEENDVIVEVYNSWYELFKVTRDEIKTMDGKFLSKDKSKEIMSLATEVLNQGLRPHLTTYQAKFRKWYNEELQKENENKTYNTPQQIQQKCEYYNELINDIKRVNNILIEYKDNLHLIIYGKSKQNNNSLKSRKNNSSDTA